MNVALTVADIASYLAVTGWARRPGTWRGASVWTREGDHEVLVPAADGMGDGESRIRGILRVLAETEGRGQDAISADIASPAADVQWYRTPDGGSGLAEARSVLEGAHEVLGAAARAVIEGPRPVFEGAHPKEVRDLLAGVGLSGPAGGPLTLRVPLEGEDPLGRRVLVLLQDAVLHARDAVATAGATGDLGAFDGVVAAGVSAELCAGLARFAGNGGGSSFETGFRWARSFPADLEPRAVAFEEGAGALLRRAGFRLRRLRFSGRASVTGAIGSLYDNGAQDRFRVQIVGEIEADGEAGARRSLWVRLPDGAAYDQAIAAHREGARVRAEGTLTAVSGRPELIAGHAGFRRIA